MNVNDDGEPLAIAQNLEVGKTYYKKHKRGEFIPVILVSLPDPNLAPPENEQVRIKHGNNGEPVKINKTMLYEVAPPPAQEDVVMLDGGRGRRRRKTKSRRTKSKRRTNGTRSSRK